jgi:hypothetical protein
LPESREKPWLVLKLLQMLDVVGVQVPHVHAEPRLPSIAIDVFPMVIYLLPMTGEKGA